MRRSTNWILAAVLAGLVGCHEGHRTIFRDGTEGGVGSNWLHESPCVSASLDEISVSASDATPPRTVTSPESGELWKITLHQAVALALEHSDVIRVLAGSDVIADATTVYDPAISETQMQEALSAFDTSLAASLFWEQDDKPSGLSFQGLFAAATRTDTANYRSSLSKKLGTGGQVGVALNNDYLFVPQRRRNPFTMLPNPDDKAQYAPNVEFSVRQPLLKGAGVDFNRAPIVIARLQSDQSLWDLKQAMLSLVRSVEEAYWNLYAAHVALRTVEEVLPLAQELVRILGEQRTAGVRYGAEVAEAREAFAEFRQNRTQALNAVLQREATLRNLLGLPPSDERRLAPTDEPLSAPVELDWSANVAAALEHRPEVVRRRLAVRIRELELLVARNGLKPQLDAQALWRINGLGTRLDNAVEVLDDNQFTDWQLGVTFSMPLGFRQATAQTDAAELRLDKERAQLRQVVHSTTHRLSDSVRDLDSIYEQFVQNEDQSIAASEWVRGKYEQFRNPPPAQQGELPGDSIRRVLTSLELALRAQTNAKASAASLLARYNTTLARLEEEKGTLLDRYNIRLQEDPLVRIRFGHVHLATIELPASVPQAMPTPPARPTLGFISEPDSDPN